MSPPDEAGKGQEGAPPIAGPVQVRPSASLIKNVVSNWAGLGSTVVYSLVITPVVIRGLEREAYGIWSFLNGLVAYSGLLYVGLGAALIKFVAQYYAVGDRPALNRLVSVVFTVYVGIGLLTLAAGLSVAPLVPGLLLRPAAVTPAATVSLAVVLFAARLGLMFVGSVFSGVLVARGRTDRYRAVTIGGNVARLVLVPLAVSVPNPLVPLAATVVFTGAIEVTALAAMAFRQDRDLRCNLVVPQTAELRMLYGFGLLAFLLQAADNLISYTDTTVIGLMLGPEEVALYVLPLQLVEYGRIVVLGLIAVLLPHLSALVATGQRARLQFSYRRVLKATALVAIFVNLNILSLGQPFLRLWVGPTFSEPALPVIVALAIASLAQAVSVHSQTPFCLAMNRVRVAAFLLVVEGLANLSLSVVFAPRYGIAGVAVATAIPAVVMSGAVLPAYVARQVGVSLRSVFRSVVLPALAFLVATGVGHVVIHFTVPGDSYWVLGTRFALGALIATGAVWAVLSDGERRIIAALVERKRRRVALAWGRR